ncbi:hypothetical protein D3C71_1455380 [compost metagenome]
MNNRLEGQHIREGVGRNRIARFNADRHQAAVLEADDRDEQADADGDRMLQAVRNGVKQNLPDLGNRKQDKDQAGDKYRRQAHLPGERMIRRG